MPDAQDGNEKSVITSKMVTEEQEDNIDNYLKLYSSSDLNIVSSPAISKSNIQTTD